MDSLGQVLPYLQHLPPTKMRRAKLIAALWRIDPAKLDLVLARLEKSYVPPMPRSKRARTESSSGAEHGGADKTPSSKRMRPAAKGAIVPATPAAPPTPSVFRRFMNSLATPLRLKARMDGAETPAPRTRFRSISVTKSSSSSRSQSKQQPPRKMSNLHRVEEFTGSPAERSPLLKELPASAMSPSFGRSGVLSPSFAGSLKVTPRKATPLGKRAPPKCTLESPARLGTPLSRATDAKSAKAAAAARRADTTANSPAPNALISGIENATPTSKGLFSFFTRPTPRRESPIKVTTAPIEELELAIRG